MSDKESYKHFTQSDRYELAILLRKGYSQSDIGDVISKNKSSISREIKNNSVNGVYDPKKANQKAQSKRRFSKYQAMKIREHTKLEKYIEAKLKLYWSPEKIANRWNTIEKDDSDVSISHVAIYKYLYSAYGQKFCKYLCTERYKPRRRKKKKTKREIIKDRISIEFRPSTANKRKRFGDFEGDTMGRIKTDNEAVVGLIERQSRYLLLDKVSRLKYTIESFSNMLLPYQKVTKSLTLDNGVENVRYKELGIITYFCHPYSSWEKGSIEHAFKRLRRFIPKKASLKDYSYQDIQHFAYLINNQPMKCLNWHTPSEIFKEQMNNKLNNKLNNNSS